MVFAFAGDSTITRIFFCDFFSAVFTVFVFFAVPAFAFRADACVANPSVPFGTPIGVHVIFYDNSL